MKTSNVVLHLLNMQESAERKAQEAQERMPKSKSPGKWRLIAERHRDEATALERAITALVELPLKVEIVRK